MQEGISPHSKAQYKSVSNQIRGLLLGRWVRPLKVTEFCQILISAVIDVQVGLHWRLNININRTIGNNSGKPVILWLGGKTFKKGGRNFVTLDAKDERPGDGEERSEAAKHSNKSIKKELLAVYNSKGNRSGGIMCGALGDTAVLQGISLHETPRIVMLNYARSDGMRHQALGRVMRACSMYLSVARDGTSNALRGAKPVVVPYVLVSTRMADVPEFKEESVCGDFWCSSTFILAMILSATVPFRFGFLEFRPLHHLLWWTFNPCCE